MNRRDVRRGLFCLLSATVVLVLASVSRAVSVDCATFGQLDWYNDCGTRQTPYSSWGRVDLTVTADPSAFAYVNVVGAAGHGPAWLVRNLPILPSTYGAPANQAAFFDITMLGISSGTPLSSMNVLVTVDSTPQTSQPTGSMSSASVPTLDRKSTGGVGFSLPSDPGTSRFFNPSAAPTEVLHHAGVPPVQEGLQCCLPGSLSRSIKWLDVQYDLTGLAPGKTAQQVYSDLVALNIGAPFFNGQTNTYTDMMRNKNGYLKGLDSRALTKVLDLSGSINYIAGVPEDNTTDLVTWLYRELPSNDVEMHYDDHIVTVTGIYKLADNVIITYRDDETQGDATKGDIAEKSGQLFKMGPNSYNFLTRAAGFDVKVAFSEAVLVPEPATATLAALGVAAISRLRRRRRVD